MTISSIAVEKGLRRGWMPATLLLVLAFLAGCAGMYLNPGENPARVRVVLDARVDNPVYPVDNRGIGPLQWQWGLYLVDAKGDLIPLRPESGESLQVFREDNLKRDTVFLTRGGKQKLRLIIEGYVSVSNGLNSSYPHDVAFLEEDFDLDLPAGGTYTITKTMR